MSLVHRLLIGRHLAGRYTIQRVIGTGGMGAIFQARDQRLERDVAIKVIAPVRHGPEATEHLRRRLQREAQAAAKIHHPNVITIYDYGADKDLDLDFIAMELLQGVDLHTFLEENRAIAVHMYPKPALQLVKQAILGLAAGHRAGLVHRDIKPANLYLHQQANRSGSPPILKVLDFGIVAIDQAEETITQLTEFGRAPLSRAYASPEQLFGTGSVTAASDVFSLGAVACHILRGGWTLSDPRAFHTYDHAVRFQNEVYKTLTSLQSHLPASDQEFLAVLRKAMAFHAEERHSDAVELLEHFEYAEQLSAEITHTEVRQHQILHRTDNDPGRAVSRFGHLPVEIHCSSIAGWTYRRQFEGGYAWVVGPPRSSDPSIGYVAAAISLLYVDDALGAIPRQVGPDTPGMAHCGSDGWWWTHEGRPLDPVFRDILDRTAELLLSVHRPFLLSLLKVLQELPIAVRGEEPPQAMIHKRPPYIEIVGEPTENAG